ncbi:TPA: hypothetical protein ACVU3Y_001472 [Vibrio parahaemolyticus]
MKTKIITLILCCFTAFFTTAQTHAQIKKTKGNKYNIYYYSTTYSDRMIFTYCFYGRTNNPFENGGSNWLGLGDRKHYSFTTGDIKICEEMLDSTHRYK